MPNTIEIKFENLHKVLASLAQLGADYEHELEAGLYQEAEKVMAASKRLVPVDLGALRSTGHVPPPEKTGDEITVTMAYGGPAGPPFNKEVGYAVHVHENLRAHHKVGQAKYLEQPYAEASNDMDERLSKRLQKVIDAMK